MTTYYLRLVFQFRLLAWLVCACFLGAELSAADPIAPDEVVEEPAPRMVGSEPLPSLPQESFTIVVIPDTQHYRGAGCKHSPDSVEPVTNKNLEAQVQWIIDHQQSENIAFVTHVGDIVDEDRVEEWEVAKRHLDRLHGVVPFSLTVGNHDMSTKGDASLFQRFFPASDFEGYAWYHATYKHERLDQNVSANNVNSAQLFSAGGMDFVHLSLECNAPDDVLAWADGLLTKFADRRAIITTHMDLGILDKPTVKSGYIHDPKGRMRWVKIHGNRGNTGEKMWDKLYRKHSNLFMVFSGDQSRVTALRLDRPADDGHTVYAMLSDYMSEPVLRLCRFQPNANKIDVLTYHVTKKVLIDRTNYVEESREHQFSLGYSMKP